VLDSGAVSRAWVQIAAATLSGNSLRQTVHTHRACIHQAAKLVAAFLRVARRKVMAAYRRVYDSPHQQADCQERGSATQVRTLRSAIEYMLSFYHWRRGLPGVPRAIVVVFLLCVSYLIFISDVLEGIGKALTR